MKPGSKERVNMVAALRKRGNFYIYTEKNILQPVRKSKRSETEYYTCTHCLGYYSKTLLYKHVKTCKSKPENSNKLEGKCMTQAQTFMASVKWKNQDFLKASRIRSEVFKIMRPDEISFEAKADPMICLYGENLLNKHKRQQISIMVSNKIREMARLLIAIKSFDSQVTGLFDLLKPERFLEQKLLANTILKQKVLNHRLSHCIWVLT